MMAKGLIRKVLAVTVLGVLVVAGCSESDADKQNREIQKAEKAEADRQQAWIFKGQDAVKAKLKDPESAQFKDTFFNKGSSNVPVSCGWVNSKNGFGGFTGYQRYVSAGKAELTFLEEQVTDFQIVWNKFCK